GRGPDPGLLAEPLVAPLGIRARVTGLHTLRLSVDAKLHQPPRHVVALLGARNQLDLRRRALRDGDLAVDGHIAGDVRGERLAELLFLDRDVPVKRDWDAGSGRDVYVALGESGRRSKRQTPPDRRGHQAFRCQHYMPPRTMMLYCPPAGPTVAQTVGKRPWSTS